MRLIFICLLVVNVMVGVWGIFFRSAPVDLAQEPSTAQAKIKTITVGADKSIAAPKNISPSESEEQRLCQLVGAFDSDEAADVFIERLRSIDIESRVEHIELPAGASYWVHLPIEETAAAAYKKLSELQALGIESYVIAKGRLKNAVSLGVFTYENLAMIKKNEIEAAGLNPVVTARPKTEIEIWVVVEPEHARKMSSLTWERMLEGMSLQERRENLCLPVASSENIH